MKQILIIWSYWILFLIVCGGVVYIVKRSANQNEAKKETHKDMELNKDLLKIEGKEWIAAKEKPEWTPPQEDDNVTVPIKPGQTDQEPDKVDQEPGKVDQKVEESPPSGDPKPVETVLKSGEEKHTPSEKDLKVLEEVKKINEEKPDDPEKDGTPK